VRSNDPDRKQRLSFVRFSQVEADLCSPPGSCGRSRRQSIRLHALEHRWCTRRRPAGDRRLRGRCAALVSNSQ